MLLLSLLKRVVHFRLAVVEVVVVVMGQWYLRLWVQVSGGRGNGGHLVLLMLLHQMVVQVQAHYIPLRLLLLLLLRVASGRQVDIELRRVGCKLKWLRGLRGSNLLLLGNLLLLVLLLLLRGLLLLAAK